MVDKERQAELEGLSPLYLQSLCLGAGLDATGSKAKLINRLLKSESQVEPPEPPAEPTEPTGEGTGEGGEGSAEPGED